jgi:hypothetical protein
MWIKRSLVTLIATGSLVLPLAFATTASAGISCAGNVTNAPDGRIKFEGGPWEGGGGFYPFADASAPFVEIGEQVLFTAKWKNVSGVIQTIRVGRHAHFSEGYAVRFFVDGVNVTQRIRADKSLVFRDVVPDKSATLIVTIRNKTAVEELDQAFEALNGRYGGAEATVCDSVDARVNNFG